MAFCEITNDPLSWMRHGGYCWRIHPLFRHNAARMTTLTARADVSNAAFTAVTLCVRAINVACKRSVKKPVSA